MTPLLTSLLGLLALLTGACTLVLMLELRGNPRDNKEANQWLIQAHRLLGWVSVGFMFVVLLVMLIKLAQYQDEFPPRILLHSALGILLIPLLALKIFIVKRFKRLGSMVPGFGLSLFLVLFLLYALTGGYYFVHKSATGEVSLTEYDTDVLDAAIGRQLVMQKCTKCHTLERVFRAVKTEKGWTQTINRMAAIDAPNIRDFDAKQIIHYLIVQQEEREQLAVELHDLDREIGRTLFSQKCVLCHSLDRAYFSEKNPEEWTKIIDRMISHAKDPDFLNEEEKGILIQFLSTQEAESTHRL
jgi:mono/diheme cytochrome c family protein